MKSYIKTIYPRLNDRIRMLDEEGNIRYLTCVEGEGCNGCEFKREAGKPQHEFCQAVACGEYERMDALSVMFQEQKDKTQEQ
jgi:hypothetical protein